jgi:rRNA-processing protein EBP2
MCVFIFSTEKMVQLSSEDPLVHDEVDMDDVDTGESDSEDDSGEEAQAMPSDKAIYNREAILEKLRT